MKKILVLFIIAVLFSCTEDNTTVTRTKQEQLALDIDRIKGYIEEKNTLLCVCDIYSHWVTISRYP